MGGGIWAMHFIGMLAFALPCGVSYDPLGTVGSMVPGILASGAALSVISRTTAPGFVRLVVGALLMGGGIGAMHYTGMAAMRPEALLMYDPTMVGVSVLVAAALAFVSLGVHFGLRQTLSLSRIPATIVAATIMGVGVAGMHYTAMDAARFYPLESAIAGGLHLPNTLLAMLIAMFAIVVASAALAASYAGRQIDLVARLSSEMTQRADLQRDAQRSRARTQAIVDAVADAIVTIDRGGKIHQWSLGAERIFGYTADEVIGSDLTILMPEPHRTRHHRYVDAFVATREAKIIGIGRELTAVRKDGSEFPIDLTVTEVKGIDEVLFTGILRDITDRKRAEQELVDARRQAEAASQAKSEFLATMSHEIRTPMNGVLGMASLLASTPLNDRQSRLTENLMRSGQALMAIINDILDFSKIEAGRVDLLEADFDPREVVAEVADLFSERCATKGLEFVYFVDEAVPANLRGDPIRLRQVCMNLVSNAIKFTERGEILVEMGVAETHADHIVLNIAVVDTGIGIPADKRAAVFESFHQVDGSMSRSRGGSGLGLAIVKQLVSLMGGQIGVESELGRGSRFWFTVRLQKSASEATAPRAPRHLARTLSVLLVDANAVSAHVTSQYLASWGLDPSVHTTPQEARAAWDEAVVAGTGFDVAIIDLKGLGKAGADLAAAIRTDPRRKAAADIISLASVDSFVGEGGDDRQAAFATLSKPIRPSELFDCLASIAAGTRKRHVSPLLARRTARARRQFNARVLVAEDNPINQDVALGMLTNMGCRVVTVPNGRAAVQAFAQDKFDLILMDCEMPDMDGFQAAKRIRDTERLMNALPENKTHPKRIPIIAVTAHALPEMRLKCAIAGMDDFITKPFDDLQLTEAMRRQLESSPQPLYAAAGPRITDREEGMPGEPIDTTAIEQIRVIEARGSAGLLKRVLTRFIDAGPAMAAEIRAKFDARDADALWKAAHGLKSSASAVGAVQVSMRCGEIETAARLSGADAAAGMIELLDAELATAVQSLQSLLGEANATVH
jgi:PAS domain S-box-containing protein